MWINGKLTAPRSFERGAFLMPQKGIKRELFVILKIKVIFYVARDAAAREAGFVRKRSLRKIDCVRCAAHPNLPIPRLTERVKQRH